MKKLIGLAVSQLLVLSLPAAAQNVDPPAGAAKVGSSWCVFVNGNMRTFLEEVTRLVDAGAEIQGSVEWREESNTYSVLVCKRGGGSSK